MHWVNNVTSVGTTNPADVRLISAAPDLLAELVDAERWMRDLGAGESMVLADTLVEVADRYRATIAKARGGEA